VGRIVETTVPASRYFGVVLDEAETFRFVVGQLCDLLQALGKMTERAEEAIAMRTQRCDMCQTAGAGPLVRDYTRRSGTERSLLCLVCKLKVDRFEAGALEQSAPGKPS
jgi:hypothetical protein